jgi:hypothetical protein
LHQAVTHCFAGDRLYTHWLKLIGHGAHEIPMLQVDLTRAGNDIKSVTAQVCQMGQSLQSCLPLAIDVLIRCRNKD